LFVHYSPRRATAAEMTIFSLVLLVFSEVGRELRFAKKGVTDLQLASKYHDQINAFVKGMGGLGHAQKNNPNGKSPEALARTRASILRAALDYWTRVNSVRNSVHAGREGDDSEDYADTYDPLNEECFLQFMQPMIGKLARGEAPSREVKQCYDSIAHAFRAQLVAALDVHFHAIDTANKIEVPKLNFTAVVDETPAPERAVEVAISKEEFLNLSRLQKLYVLTH
jgi:hypothetical protein